MMSVNKTTFTQQNTQLTLLRKQQQHQQQWNTNSNSNEKKLFLPFSKKKNSQTYSHAKQNIHKHTDSLKANIK